MPRVAIKSKDYAIQDFAGWVIYRMRMLGIKQEALAAELNISQQAMSVRLNIERYKNGKIKDPFTLGDVLTLFKVLEATDEEKQRLLTL